jgi:FixJ family two-component response regulator
MRARAVHTVEANGSSAERARAQLQHKLKLAGYLEQKSREEVDRFSALAALQGWTNRQLADVLGVTIETVIMRRKRGFSRKRLAR